MDIVAAGGVGLCIEEKASWNGGSDGVTSLSPAEAPAVGHSRVETGGRVPKGRSKSRLRLRSISASGSELAILAIDAV